MVYGSPGWVRGKHGATSRDDGSSSGGAGVGSCSFAACSSQVSHQGSSHITRLVGSSSAGTEVLAVTAELLT